MALLRNNLYNPTRDIGTLKEFLMENLTSDDVILQFSAQITSKQNKEIIRVKNCYEHMSRYGLLPRKPLITKCDEFAIKTKEIGNDHFKKNEFFPALIAYDMALKYATDPKTISHIYGNRSAVLIRLKMFKECILDIERALDLGCNEDRKPKLLKRKEECENIMKVTLNQKDDFDIEGARKKLFNLTEKKMNVVACASGSLEIVYSSTMGRGIAATEDISPGQVLISEEPYAYIHTEDNIHFRCYYCNELNYCMIPCKSCTFAMFCNEKCRSKSWSLGHKFECPIMSRLVAMKFSHVDLLSLRVLLKARTQYLSWNDMFDSIELAEQETMPERKGFSLDADNTYVYDSDSYIPIHMLETNIEKKDADEMIHRCVSSVALLHMLKEYTTFFGDHINAKDDILKLDKDDYVWRIGGLLLHLNMILGLNNYPISVSKQQGLEFVNIPFAAGAYAFSSLINHSCAPNVCQVNCGNTFITVALRPIKKGQQIFVNYAMHYSQQGLEIRSTHLQNKFKFKCQCEACVNNWPTINLLKPVNFNNKKNKSKFRNIIDVNLIQHLKNVDKKFAYYVVQDLFRFIEMLEGDRPSLDHLNHENCIRHCLGILSNYENPFPFQISLKNWFDIINNINIQ